MWSLEHIEQHVYYTAGFRHLRGCWPINNRLGRDFGSLLADQLIDTIENERTDFRGILCSIETVCAAVALECQYGNISEGQRREYISFMENEILNIPIKEVRRKCNKRKK